MNPADIPTLQALPLKERLRLVEELWKSLQQDPGSPPPGPPRKPTVEEQMAAYEDHLKQTDWGHQPC